MDFVFLVNLEEQIASDYERKGGRNKEKKSWRHQRRPRSHDVVARETSSLPTCAQLLTPGDCEGRVCRLLVMRLCGLRPSA